ncbi:hypothetical protein PHLH6_30920 [Pseudomonas sp. Seg1]|uniref:hypothetical protein n=1 Tax=Pseudomonas sp. Seg1 TaxID=2678259 RepID=UPI001BB4580A|nr:hypothetical protein [Pseudomonas sp. Seg1]BBP71088.1 hypothetical protein PHLH6_30920 [Pseudomonas sp. Seg1]
MSTTGTFEVVTDSPFGALKPSEIELSPSEEAYKVRVRETIGNAGRAWTDMELMFPKFDKFAVFDVAKLSSVKFSSLSDSYLVHYLPLSGKLTVWYAKNGEINGVFTFEMGQNEQGYPTKITVIGLFSLINK